MSNKLQKIAIIASLVIVMGGSLTFLMTWRNLGFSDGFIGAWLSSFALCIVCIAPIGGIISFLVHRLVNAMWPNLSKLANSVVFGLIMATIMECIMAVVTTINLHGLLGLRELAQFWAATFAAALPAGIVFSVIISVIVKPRLMAFWAK